MPTELHDRLKALDDAGLRRVLAAPSGLDLSSNDYLGLAEHPAIREALQRALADGLPTGSTGSRLLSGEHPAWSALEARVAAWQGAEAALVFNSGFAANTGLLAALPEPGDLILSDALNHASLIDGARASRADRLILPHNDLDALASALREHAGRRCWVVVESVYSMDGDEADLPALAALCAAHAHTHLLVDEAHATGLYGPQGQGRVVALGLRDAVSATIHPCGKAIGLQGAYVAGSHALRDWLIQRARPFVFSTAMPPFFAAAHETALDLLADPALDRTRPRALGDRLRARLAGHLDTAGSTTHIVPLIVGAADRALALQAHLHARGWHARAIRPPTVPAGTCRVRLVLRSPLTDADVDRLADDLLTWTP